MSQRRVRKYGRQELLDRLARAEATSAAWQARFWEVASGGRLIPSDEDREKHEALIGPMPDLDAFKVWA